MFLFCALCLFAATTTPKPRRRRLPTMRGMITVEHPFWGLDMQPRAIEGQLPNPNLGYGFQGNMGIEKKIAFWTRIFLIPHWVGRILGIVSVRIISRQPLVESFQLNWTLSWKLPVANILAGSFLLALVNLNFRGKKLTIISIAVITNALLIADIAVLNYCIFWI